VKFKLRSARWSHGVLSLVVTLPRGEKLTVVLEYTHRRPRTVKTTRTRISIHTPKPRRVLLRVYSGKHQVGRTIVVKL
jgi:hypothetical protein